MFGKTTTTTRNYLERSAALERRKTEITEAAATKARELQRELGKSNERAAADLEAAQADEQAATRGLEHELVRDFYAAVGPLAAQWRDEPSRAVALKIGDALTRLLERERAELGETSAPRVLRLLCFAIIDQVIKARPEGVKVFASDDPESRIVEALAAVRRSLGMTIELEGTLRNLEATIERRAAEGISGEVQPAAERYAARRMLDAEAVKAIDDRRVQQAREKAERDDAEYAEQQRQLERGQHLRQGSRVA